jgi:hypothetical protein
MRVEKVVVPGPTSWTASYTNAGSSWPSVAASSRTNQVRDPTVAGSIFWSEARVDVERPPVVVDAVAFQHRHMVVLC